MKAIDKHIGGVVLLAAVLLLVGCRSSKTGLSTDGNGRQQTELVEKVQANRLAQNTLTAKVNVSIEARGKHVSVGGNLKMKRDDVIQLSLVALGFIEAGRLEITKDYVLVVDRINHQYIKEEYQALPWFQQTQLDFYALQALFWNELFVPGKQDRVEATDFTVSTAGQSAVLEARGGQMLALRFVTALAGGLIKQVNVSKVDDPAGIQLNWAYPSFGQVNKQPFPDKMQISVDGLKETYRLSLSLSSMKDDAKRETRTNVNTNKYKKVELTSILDRLMGL